MGIHGLWGKSFKTACRESNLIVVGIVLLSYRVPRVPMVWGHTQETYCTGIGEGGPSEIMRAHQKTALCIRPDFIGHYKIEPFCFVLLLLIVL